MKSSQAFMTLLFCLFACPALVGCAERLSVPRQDDFPPQRTRPAADGTAHCVSLAGRYRQDEFEHELTQDGCKAMTWVRNGPALSETHEYITDGVERETTYPDGSRMLARAYYRGESLWIEKRLVPADGVVLTSSEKFFRGKSPCSHGTEGAHSDGPALLAHETRGDGPTGSAHCEIMSPL